MKATSMLIAAFAVALLAPAAEAQTAEETRATLQQKTKPGDRVTVSLRDGVVVQGRLGNALADHLIVRTKAGDRSVVYSDVERVARRRNGVLLGAALGTAVGFLVGVPYMIQWNRSDGSGGESFLWTIVGISAGSGVGIDAILSRNRTVYRRTSATHHVALQPQPRGGAVRWQITW